MCTARSMGRVEAEDSAYTPKGCGPGLCLRGLSGFRFHLKLGARSEIIFLRTYRTVIVVDVPY